MKRCFSHHSDGLIAFLFLRTRRSDLEKPVSYSNPLLNSSSSHAGSVVIWYVGVLDCGVNMAQPNLDVLGYLYRTASSSLYQPHSMCGKPSGHPQAASRQQ